MGKLIKERLAAQKVVRVIGVGQLCSPKLIEMIGLHGRFDAVWLDQEHGGLSIAQLEQAALAARARGIDSFVRLAATDYATVMRVLEAGAGGIMAAQVRSAKEAEDIVRWAKFHPHGQRGVNGTGVDGRFGTMKLADYFERANEETFIAIQIENREAVEDVERIAAVKQVDLLFVGPADLSQSLGVPGDIKHPEVWQAIERVARAAQANGIHWAILPRDPEHAKRCVGLGCRMLSMGLDTWVVSRGLDYFQKEYAEFFAD
ncbi:MAG: HpcH/HpaI aldolase/citrate lyase family protein [Gemmataceae bacterium]